MQFSLQDCLLFLHVNRLLEEEQHLQIQQKALGDEDINPSLGDVSIICKCNDSDGVNCIGSLETKNGRIYADCSCCKDELEE